MPLHALLPMSAAGRLSLGALFREMRAGLGDAGWVQIAVEFHQRTLAATSLAEPAAQADSLTLLLRATVDHLDGVLHRGEVSLSGPLAEGRLVVLRHQDGYAYSVDGGRRWGRFTARPRLFDIEEFEKELGRVAVEDVTFQPVGARGRRAGEPSSPVGGEGHPLRLPTAGAEYPLPLPGAGGSDALDVSLGRGAFSRLLRIFAADVDEKPEALTLSAYSVSLEAAEDVSLSYWWSMSGPDGPVPALLEDAPDAHGMRVSCGVSIRVLPGAEPVVAELELDPELPELARIDDVWALMRRRRSAGPGA